MKINMNEWKNSILNSTQRQAILIMTYPGLHLIGKTVFDMVTQGEIQQQCIKVLKNRYPQNACSTLIMDLSVEAEVFGSELNFSTDEIPTVSKRLIESFEEIENIKIPENVGTHRTTQHIKAAKLTSESITDQPVLGGVIGPYSFAGRLFDMTEMMTGILIAPDGANQLLQICTNYIIKYAQAFKEAGCNGIIIAEPAAGLLAEDQCAEFSSQYVKQIVDKVQDENFMVILHNCGNTVSLVDTMVSTGCGGLHFGNAVNMLDILPQVPSDILVMGNLDPARLIKNGTPETIRLKTLELLNNTAQYQNFILSTGCDVPPGTKLENIDAIFEALNEFNTNI